MSKDAMKQHGVFSWNELMTTDVQAAKAFYGEVLGWTFAEFEGGEMDYTMAKMGDIEVGGLMTKPPEAEKMPPCWGSYITVDDVDKRSKQAESLGGKVLVGPQDVPKVGRFVVIADPQGAVVSLITYSDDSM